MREFRTTAFFAVLVVFVGTLLITTWHSIDDHGPVTETGLAPPTPMTTGTPAEDSHLLLPPDAATIGTSGQEYYLFSPLPHLDMALSSRALRFDSLRTGETSTDTGHACEEAAVREVSISREGNTVPLTVSLDRDPDDARRQVHLRLIGPDATVTSILRFRSYRDRDRDGVYGPGDTPAVDEVSVELDTLTSGLTYVVLASVHADFPSHATRGVRWTAGQEDEMTPDPAAASRIQVLSGSYVTIASCRPGAAAQLVLIDGEAIVANGNGGRILRTYDVTTGP
ncbi:MAG: hypothetical protein F4X66_15320 [Chloroflexi bacterium]|nr:hypothetical protein [Chloroflexota bacterium]MYE40229.1 hypothetical protein [Chloroflexota bacterium]